MPPNQGTLAPPSLEKYTATTTAKTLGRSFHRLHPQAPSVHSLRVYRNLDSHRLSNKNGKLPPLQEEYRFTWAVTNVF